MARINKNNTKKMKQGCKHTSKEVNEVERDEKMYYVTTCKSCEILLRSELIQDDEEIIEEK